MEPIISPWLIYLLGVSDPITFYCGMMAFLSGVAIILYIFFSCVEHTFYHDSSKEAWKRIKPKLARWSISLFIIFGLINIIAPSRTTLISMIIAQNITPVNVEKALKTGKDFKDELKKDVIDIIQSVTKEEKKK